MYTKVASSIVKTFMIIVVIGIHGWNFNLFSTLHTNFTSLSTAFQYFYLNEKHFFKSNSTILKNIILYRPIKVLKNLVKNIIKSSLFMAVFVATFRFMMCHTKNFRGKVDRWNVIISCITCSFAILFEPASRRSEIAMYLVPRALESLWTLQVRAGRVKNLLYGEELVFALSMALLMYCY